MEGFLKESINIHKILLLLLELHAPVALLPLAARRRRAHVEPGLVPATQKCIAHQCRAHVKPGLVPATQKCIAHQWLPASAQSEIRAGMFPH